MVGLAVRRTRRASLHGFEFGFGTGFGVSLSRRLLRLRHDQPSIPSLDVTPP